MDSFKFAGNLRQAKGTVWSLYADPSGSLWIGAYGRGIFRYDSGHFKNLTVRDGRGRFEAARSRHRSAARGGRFHHATRDCRKHERADHHDCREGRGHDSSPVEFIAQANLTDPWFMERFGEENFPKCYRIHVRLVNWDRYWRTRRDTNQPSFWKWLREAS